VTDSIRLFTESLTINDGGAEPVAKRFKYVRMTLVQLSRSTPASHPLLDTSSPSGVAVPAIQQPAYVNNAKYDDICCKLIKPLYDGADLMAYLLCIHNQSFHICELLDVLKGACLIIKIDAICIK
jgi:hypothetical protein